MKILRSGAFWTVMTFTAVIVNNYYMERGGHLKCSVLVFFAYLIAYFPGLLVGVAQGKGSEKNRALALCRQSFDARMSGSVRRVMNGIAEDRTKLLSEDEFFGPEPGAVSSVQPSGDTQERPPSGS